MPKCCLRRTICLHEGNYPASTLVLTTRIHKNLLAFNVYRCVSFCHAFRSRRLRRRKMEVLGETGYMIDCQSFLCRRSCRRNCREAPKDNFGQLEGLVRPSESCPLTTQNGNCGKAERALSRAEERISRLKRQPPHTSIRSTLSPRTRWIMISFCQKMHA